MELSSDVHIEPTSGCWLWGGESTRIEVSLANVRRKTYSDKHGPHVGMQARPTCGSYWCVNPSHMALVAPRTKAERCKKWEAKNKPHLDAYRAAWAARNPELIATNRAKQIRKTSEVGRWLERDGQLCAGVHLMQSAQGRYAARHRCRVAHGP